MWSYFWLITWKWSFNEGGRLTFGGGNKNLVEGVYWGEIFPDGGRWSDFWNVLFRNLLKWRYQIYLTKFKLSIEDNRANYCSLDLAKTILSSLDHIHIYIYIYNIYIYNIYIYKEKNFLKSFGLLPLLIYLHKTTAISKYLQFLIYKLNESIVGKRWSTNDKLIYTKLRHTLSKDKTNYCNINVWWKELEKNLMSMVKLILSKNKG